MNKKNIISKKSKTEPGDSRKLLIENSIKFTNKFSPVKNNKLATMS